MDKDEYFKLAYKVYREELSLQDAKEQIENDDTPNKLDKEQHFWTSLGGFDSKTSVPLRIITKVDLISQKEHENESFDSVIGRLIENNKKMERNESLKRRATPTEKEESED